MSVLALAAGRAQTIVAPGVHAECADRMPGAAAIAPLLTGGDVLLVLDQRHAHPSRGGLGHAQPRAAPSPSERRRAGCAAVPLALLRRQSSADLAGCRIGAVWSRGPNALRRRRRRDGLGARDGDGHTSPGAPSVPEGDAGRAVVVLDEMRRERADIRGGRAATGRGAGNHDRPGPDRCSVHRSIRRSSRASHWRTRRPIETTTRSR